MGLCSRALGAQELRYDYPTTCELLIKTNGLESAGNYILMEGVPQLIYIYLY